MKTAKGMKLKKSREWTSFCECGKPKRYARKGPCMDCTKEKKKAGVSASNKPPADVGQKINCRVLYEDALGSGVARTFMVEARWLVETKPDPSDAEWRRVVWGLAKILKRCRVCGSKLRAANKGERCWAHTYPGYGKDTATTEDLMRSASAKKATAVDMETARNFH